MSDGKNIENRIQSEKELEMNLMQTLKSLGYIDRTHDIKCVNDIIKNIKIHFENLNSDELKNEKISESDFLIHVVDKIEKNRVFENAKLFRDLVLINKGKNQNFRLKFFDEKNVDKNVFEFSHQVLQQTREGNRGDVTIFLNGFPIVQIELKKVGVDVNKAFEQIKRYKQQSFDNNIYKILQLFIVSDDILNFYFVNNNSCNDFIQTQWSDEKNKKFSNLLDFTNSFLNKDTLFKVITKYTVFNEKERKIIVFKPYQFYAAEKVIDHIDKTDNMNQLIDNLDERSQKLNGYIWHATGSGKTLTSFKIAQMLAAKPNIEKVFFLVDRIDLNNQTINEFKRFLSEDEEDVEHTENVKHLIKQMNSPTTKIIVTTIQKLNYLLTKHLYKVNQNNKISKANYIFIIDECHRTQFGEMHKKIRKECQRARMIGFTGTPIFPANKKFMVTKEIFGDCLHSYKMVNAINDQNILPFTVEYIGNPKSILEPTKDIDAISIDLEGYFISNEWISKLVDFIFKINFQKTHGEKNKSMLVTDSIQSAITLYWKFRERYPDFKVATIFSTTFDNDENYNQLIDEENQVGNARETIWKIMEDYNQLYGTSYGQSQLDIKNYNLSIQENVSEYTGKIKLVIVVRMLTTGFNAKYLNTIYLNRSLKDYEIIQTISRANRIADPEKSRANIVSFRTYREDIENALALYNDDDSLLQIFEKDSLEKLIERINQEGKELKINWPTVNEINNEISETKQLEFIIKMRIILKLQKIAKTFIEYNENLLVDITNKEIEEYKSIYLDLYRKVKKRVKKESIIDDIDFEFESIREPDEINADFIFNELDQRKNESISKVYSLSVEKIVQGIDKFESHKKSELISKFIDLWVTKMQVRDQQWVDTDSKTLFYKYCANSIKKMIDEYALENNINNVQILEIIAKQVYEDKKIDNYEEEIRASFLNKNLTYLETKKLVENTKDFINQLEESLGSDQIAISSCYFKNEL